MTAPPNAAQAAPVDPAVIFPALRTLCLNQTGYGWAAVVARAGQMPGLAELHACKNGISALSDGWRSPRATDLRTPSC